MELLPLFLSLAVGALLGSWHCAAMCGPIACAITRKSGGLSAYHLGRLLSYLSLGAFFGYIGESVLQAPSHGLRLFAFAILAFFLSLQILPSQLKGEVLKRLPHFNRLKNYLFKRVPEKPWSVFLFGFGSASLPCGWLWTYLAAAAATKSPFAGSLVMLILWASSVPALSAMSLYFRKALDKNSTHVIDQHRKRALIVSWGLALAGYYALFSHFFL